MHNTQNQQRHGDILPEDKEKREEEKWEYCNVKHPDTEWGEAGTLP